jgi:tetratricopeptide (TPR) repeat protein
MDHGQIAEVSAELSAEAARRETLAQSPLVERLAVAATFDRDRFDTESDYPAVERLFCEPVRARGRDSEFILAEGPRVTALAGMLRRGGTGELAKIRQQLGRLPDTPLQRSLDAFVLGEAWPLAERDEDGLVASLDVWRWATEAIALAGLSQRYEVTPSRDLIESRLSVLELTRAARKLLVGGFVGRKAELARLRDYCLASTSDSRLKDPPMLVYGIGGIGKSTLIARFVMDLVAAPDRTVTTAWAYLDLDRPTLSSFEPTVLLRDIARQLAAQFSEGRRVLQRSQMVEQYRAMGSGLESADTAISFRAAALDLAGALRQLGCGRLVVVLDTFEEAERRGRRTCDQILELFAVLASELSELKLVVSGRAPARTAAHPDRPDRQLELEPFHGDEAVDLLRHLTRREADLAGVPPPLFDDALARDVVRLVGGIPLTLRLAARVLVHEGPVVDAVVRVRALDRVRTEFVQGFLYQRVLNHLVGVDPALGDALQQVARASLVLRRVTPELVEAILLPSLDPAPDVSLADLYRALSSEVALADETDGVLRLRTELRGPALAALKYDDPQLVRRVHECAAGYYAAVADTRPEARAELAYHRLAVGEPASGLADLLDDAVLASLEQSLAELPDAAARTVREARRDITVLSAERDRVDWELHAQTAVEAALRSGRLTEARRLLDERSGRSQFSQLYRLESRLSEAEGNFDAAVQAAELDRAAAAAAADPTRFAAAAVRVAALEERRGHFDRAIKVLRDAEAHPILGGHSAIRLELLLNGMNTGERGSLVDEDIRWSLELDARSLIQRTDPQEIAANTALTRLLAAALGSGEPELIREAARTIGLGHDEDPVRVDRLVEAIARWDADQPTPGSLAMAVGVRTDGYDQVALRATWKSALAGLGTDASLLLERLWSTQRPPAPVIASLRDIYLWWGVGRADAPAESPDAVLDSGFPDWSSEHLRELEEQLLAAYPSRTDLIRLAARAGLDAVSIPRFARSRVQVQAMLTEAARTHKLLDLTQAVLDDQTAAAVHPAIRSLIQPTLGESRLRLRLHQADSAGGRHRVALSLDGSGTRITAVAEFTFDLSGADAELLRWYLEDYLEGPADSVGINAAERAERRLAELGQTLFTAVFDTNADTRGIWDRISAHLATVRIEVSGTVDAARLLPWELLRDPRSGHPLALQVDSFVRVNSRSVTPSPPRDGTADGLRVLLVICRPVGANDIPFRSVALHLTRLRDQAPDLLQLDVLRPPTFARLARVLHAAAEGGRPYHLVHFDGHGTYINLADLRPDDDGNGAGGPAAAGNPLSGYGNGGAEFSVAGPVRAGQHGYLIFEDPDSPTNQQLVDGSALGQLLAATGVSVLVLNAGRSGYAEAPPEPLDAEVGHDDVPAYDSLAAEAAKAGLVGVVAMRYNVYVLTAVQFVADLYAALLAGQSLGAAVTAGRRQLAAQPNRAMALGLRPVQDWMVPVVYEAAPLTLFQPATTAGQPRLLVSVGSATPNAIAGLPRPPDVGFFGREETLLALDRAFDITQVVLLHAFAGAGKTATAAEFARWYQATGGLQNPSLSAGPVLWSSFEHHLPLDRLLDAAGDAFIPLLEASGIHWQAITDPADRRRLVLQILQQVPVLWVWDQIEPVTGFPPGTSSAWTEGEQDKIADFLRDLAQDTQCKVLLTSRRDEEAWLGWLPARIELPPMPMRERLQLAQTLAARQPGSDPDTDWRPLLRYAAGNPLTITVLVGQALRDHLATAEDLERFVARIRAGEADLEAGEDAVLGRGRSLAASLSYGFSHAFTETERAQLALLHLFRDTVDADALRYMGDPGTAGQDAVPQLVGLTREAAVGLLDRAAAIGLLSSLGSGYYQIHPAVPWYFTTLYATAYGQPGSPDAARAARAYTHTLAELGRYYHDQHEKGRADTVPVLGAEEGNLHHALTLALDAGHWADAIGCLQGLRLLYQRTGRDRELARLLAQVTPAFIDPATDGPLPGRENEWSIITGYRVRLAITARDWPAATRLQNLATARAREQAAAALAASASQLTPDQRNQIRDLDVSLENLGDILRFQEDPGCLPPYQEALALAQRIQDTAWESTLAASLGNAYLEVPGLRDLDQAQRWYQHSLDLTPEHNRVGRARSLRSLANVAYKRFEEARDARQPEPVLLGHLNAALDGCQQALGLLPAEDAENLAAVHNQLGIICGQAGDTRRALHHYQQSIKFKETRGDIYGAGLTRYNIAVLLQDDDRLDDALLYARAALYDFERTGPGAAREAAQAGDLITRLEHATR